MIYEKYEEMMQELEYPQKDEKIIQQIRDLKEEIFKLEELKRKNYREKLDEYRKKKQEIEQDFKKALFLEYGISEKVYEKAYSDGHSCGFSEIECKYMDYMELVNSAKEEK